MKSRHPIYLGQSLGAQPRANLRLHPCWSRLKGHKDFVEQADVGSQGREAYRPSSGLLVPAAGPGQHTAGWKYQIPEIQRRGF